MVMRLVDVMSWLDGWYDPATAEDWDAVGLVCGDPDQPVERVLLAVDPAPEVVEEAVGWGADLVVCHHPLLLRPVHSIAATSPKGRVLHRLVGEGIALFTAHTNADVPVGGVNEALAHAVGLGDPLVPLEAASPDLGHGRVGELVEATTLRGFAERVVQALPPTAHGVRVSGDPDRPVRRVAVGSGAGDALLDTVLDLGTDGVDAYLTSDLRHHRAAEFREHDGPALVDVAHWAAEWTWLPVVADRLAAAARRTGATVETRVSRRVTDPWSFRVDPPDSTTGRPR